MGSSSTREPTLFANENGAPMGNKAGRERSHEGGASCPFAEHRTQARYSFTAAATILEPDSGAHIEAHTTDLCLGGCYVDTMNAFPAGTIVELRLTKDEEPFHSMATVVCSQPGVGMGLSFSSVEQDQFLLLEKWYAELRGERVHEPHSLEQDESAHRGLAEKDDLRYALEDLLVQLMRKGVLNEEEGEPILRRLLH